MMHHAYRFASQAAALAAMASAPPSAELDVVGRAFGPAIASPDGEVTAGPALPGWHVNAVWPDAEPEGWAASRIDAAEAPRWWSGVPRQVVPAVPSLEAYRLAVMIHVNATAGQRGYDNAASCAGYVNSTVSAWAAEAAAFIKWRDQVWLEVFETLADVHGGKSSPPTIAELVAGLPVIGWPA